jgi:hypothetical protein
MYDDMMERVERNMGLTRLTIMGFISALVLNTVIGLVISAFVKKEQETPAAA